MDTDPNLCDIKRIVHTTKKAITAALALWLY